MRCIYKKHNFNPVYLPVLHQLHHYNVMTIKNLSLKLGKLHTHTAVRVNHLVGAGFIKQVSGAGKSNDPAVYSLSDKALNLLADVAVNISKDFEKNGK
jgi:predicted transcriptional regulator